MKLIHERVRDYALQNPEKPALVDERGEITYRALDARSARAAKMLAARGLKPGDRAAVYVPYTKDILLGAVSVLRAGGVFVPFDDAYPVERLQYMLRDSEAAAILTLRELWESRISRLKKSFFWMKSAPVRTPGRIRNRPQTARSPFQALPPRLRPCCSTPPEPPAIPRACCIPTICCFTLSTGSRFIRTRR